MAFSTRLSYWQQAAAFCCNCLWRSVLVDIQTTSFGLTWPWQLVLHINNRAPYSGNAGAFAPAGSYTGCTSIAFSAYKRSFCALKVPIPLALSQQSLHIRTAFPAQDSTWDCSWLLLAVFVCFSALFRRILCFSALFRRIQVPTMSSAEAKPRHVTQSGQDYLQHVLGLAPLSATYWAFLAKSPQVAPALILAFNRCFVHLYVTFYATTPVRYHPLQVGGNRLLSVEKYRFLRAFIWS